MFKKALRFLGIVAGVFILIVFSAVFWFYRNQDSVIAKVKEMAGASINGQLDIGGFKFEPIGRNPGLTFSLSDIHLRDSLYHTHTSDLLRIERLEVTFGWQTLFLMKVNVKHIRIQDGTVSLFRRRDGYSNLSIFKSKKPEQPADGPSLFGKIKSLQLNNVHLVYTDSLNEKHYGVLMKRVSGSYRSTRDGWEGQLNGPVHSDQLMFNSEKGAFLKDRDIHLTAALQFDKSDKELKILPRTSIQLESGEQIGISGTVATSGPGSPVALRFQTNRIRVPTATSLLADSIAVKIDSIGIDTYVSADVVLHGETGYKKSAVEVNFKTDTFSYATPFGHFRELKTDGYFTNRKDTLLGPSPVNSFVKSGTIRGYFEKVPLKGSLSITDFSNPLADVVLHASTDSSALNSLFDTDRYQATNGIVNLDLRYTGRLKNIYLPETDQLDGKMFGRVSIIGLEVTYLPRNVKLSKIESVISFTMEEVLIHRMALFDNQNQLYINGRLKHPLHPLLGSPNPASAKIDINIPEWKLNWIEVLVSQNQKKKKKPSRKLSHLLDQLMDNLRIETNLKAGQLIYHNLKARNVIGKLTMADNITDVSRLSLDAFGGKVALKGKLESPDDIRSIATFSAEGKVTNANVSNILFSFNDFGQQALSSKNVRGSLDMDFRFSSLVNPDVSLVPRSMKGHLNVNFTNGQLINFGPFLKIKKIIFKNRPLENVKIAPIRKRFELKGQEVRIQKMQIESNVVTLFVEGQYSFGDKTDLSIQFPLKNLKRRDEDYEFQRYDSEGLRSIFLRAVEEDGEVNIKLDSRKKARNRTYPDSTEQKKDSTDKQ